MTAAVGPYHTAAVGDRGALYVLTKVSVGVSVLFMYLCHKNVEWGFECFVHVPLSQESEWVVFLGVSVMGVEFGTSRRPKHSNVPTMLGGRGGQQRQAAASEHTNFHQETASTCRPVRIIPCAHLEKLTFLRRLTLRLLRVSKHTIRQGLHIEKLTFLRHGLEKTVTVLL